MLSHISNDDSPKTIDSLQNSKQKKKYQIVCDELRKKVIEKLQIERLSLKDVSDELNIKLSTCKAIQNIFLREGRLEKKKKRIRKIKSGFLKSCKENTQNQEGILSSNAKAITAKLSIKGSGNFLTGDDKNNINVWKIGNEAPLTTILNQNGNSASNVQIETTAIIYDFSENFVFSGSNRGMINIWDLNSQKPQTSLKGHMVAVSCLSIFPNEEKNNILVSGSFDNNVKLWDIRQKQCITTWKGHSMPISSLDCSPDGMWVVSGAQDRLVKIWDILTGKQIYTFNLHNGGITQTKFNNTELCLATSSVDRTIKYWNLDKFTLNCETRLEATPIQKICFSTDGKWLYSAANESLKVWDLEKQGLLLDNVESSWKGVLDLSLDLENLYGLSSSSGAVKLWSTPLKLINMPIDQKRKSSSVIRNPSVNAKLGSTQTQDKRMKFINEAQKILEQKKIDINLTDVLDNYLDKKVQKTVSEPNMEKCVKKSEKIKVETPKTPTMRSKSPMMRKTPSKINENENILDNQRRSLNRNEFPRLKEINRRGCGGDKDDGVRHNSNYNPNNNYNYDNYGNNNMNMNTNNNVNFATCMNNENEELFKLKSNLNFDTDEFSKPYKNSNQQFDLDFFDKLQKTPFENNRKSMEMSEMAKHGLNFFELTKSKSNNLNNNTKDEVDCSTYNLQNMANEDLQMSSFLLDKDLNSEKFQQFDIIKEMTREHSKFLGILQARVSYINPINHWLKLKNVTSAIFTIQKLKHYSLLLDAFNIILSQNHIESLSIDNVYCLLEKSILLLDSKYEHHIKFVLDFLLKLIEKYKSNMEKDVNPNDELIGEETKRRKINQKIEILQALNNNSRLNKIAKSPKNIAKKANHLKCELEEIIQISTVKSIG